MAFRISRMSVVRGRPVSGLGIIGRMIFHWASVMSDVEGFDDIKTAISDCLHRVETDYKTEFETLMKPNFQDFKKSIY